jgi:hypothetical protein
LLGVICESDKPRRDFHDTKWSDRRPTDGCDKRGTARAATAAPEDRLPPGFAPLWRPLASPSVIETTSEGMPREWFNGLGRLWDVREVPDPRPPCEPGRTPASSG